MGMIKHSFEILAVARLFHPRLQRVGRAVGEAIAEQSGAFVEHREFYWRQTAPLHRVSTADPIAQGLWAEAFREGYAQSASSLCLSTVGRPRQGEMKQHPRPKRRNGADQDADG